MDEAPLRFAVMYSSQIRRKKKKWQDGEAVYNPRKSRLTLKDDSGAFLASHWVYKRPKEGDEIMFESFVVQIEQTVDVLQASQPTILRTTPMKVSPVVEDSLQRVLEAGPSPRAESGQNLGGGQRGWHSSLDEPSNKRACAGQSDYDLRVEDEALPVGGGDSLMWSGCEEPGFESEPEPEPELEPEAEFESEPEPEPQPEPQPEPSEPDQSPSPPPDSIEPPEPEQLSLQEIISSQSLNHSAHSSPVKPRTSQLPPETTFQFPVFADPSKRQKGQPSLLDLLGPSKQSHSLQHTADSLKAKNASIESPDCEIIYSKRKTKEWLHEVPVDRPSHGPWTWEAYWLVSWRPTAEVKREQ